MRCSAVDSLGLEGSILPATPATCAEVITAPSTNDEGSPLRNDRTDDLSSQLRHQCADFGTAHDRSAVLDGIIDTTDTLLLEDAQLPERVAEQERAAQEQEDQRARAAYERVTNAAMSALMGGASPCLVGLLIVVITVIVGSTPWWTLLIGFPALLAITMGLTYLHEAIEQRPVADLNLAWCYALAGLVATTGLTYLAVALVWPTSGSGWIVFAILCLGSAGFITNRAAALAHEADAAGHR